MSRKLVYGVGYYEKSDRFFSGTSPFQTKEYKSWRSMLRRCYSKEVGWNTDRKSASYLGCTVSDNFKNFQYFAEWCHNQKGYGLEGYSLDKDILFKGNKEYHEDKCVFVPQELNNFPLSCKFVRGDYPIGVTFDKRQNRFVSKIYFDGVHRNIGSYSNSEDAFNAYKTAKEFQAKQLAIKHKGLVDERVIEALNNYTVEVTD